MPLGNMIQPATVLLSKNLCYAMTIIPCSSLQFLQSNSVPDISIAQTPKVGAEILIAILDIHLYSSSWNHRIVKP